MADYNRRREYHSYKNWSYKAVKFNIHLFVFITPTLVLEKKSGKMFNLDIWQYREETKEKIVRMEKLKLWLNLVELNNSLKHDKYVIILKDSMS